MECSRIEAPFPHFAPKQVWERKAILGVNGLSIATMLTSNEIALVFQNLLQAFNVSVLPTTTFITH
jgi:hypothetical protein